MKNGEMNMKIVLAMTGASGVIYGIRLLEYLSKNNHETHLVMTKWARENIKLETDYIVEDILKLASYYYEENRLDAAISSGSFLHDGMIVAPCSMKTLAGIVNGYDENLVIRAAGVTIKERRELILLPRETPMTSIQLGNMLKLSDLGVVLMPPIPAFYIKPKGIDDLINHTVSRVLDQLKIKNDLTTRWG